MNQPEPDMAPRIPTDEKMASPSNGVHHFDQVKWTRGKHLLYWSAMILVILAAIGLRTDDLIAWHKQPHRAFYDDRPLLINFDGYYYLSLARDLRQGTYFPVDALRGVPESPMRPTVPPLLSLLTAVLDRLLPVSLEWIAVLLPPLLGILLAVPLMLFGRLFGGRMMSLTAAAMGLFPSYYVYRSHLGWFDTDCLNVTFLLLICYFFIRFGILAQRRRYLYLAAAVTTYGLFLLWWDQTPWVVTLISFSSLVVVSVLYYRPNGRERRVAICVGAVLVVGIFFWQGAGVVGSIYQKGFGQLFYISKQQPDAFPNVGISVKEQKKAHFNDISTHTTGHPVSFSFGLAGLAMLAWRFRGRAAALIVPFGIGCLSFLFARRFLIFLNPFLAIGFAFAAQWLWDLRLKWRLFQFLVPPLVAASLFIPFNQSLRLTFWPKEIPPLVEGMDLLSQAAPEDALVWAWWDHGYPLLYWARRATINDGSLHSGLRTVSNAIPISADSPLLAANFMRFYSVRGIGGMEKLFAEVQGPGRGMKLLENVLMADQERALPLIAEAGLEPAEQWQRFFFPDVSRPLFLFLDLRLARSTYWWYWFGKWDVDTQTGEHPEFKMFPNCRRRGDEIFGRDVLIDLRQGVLFTKGKAYPLKKAFLRNGRLWRGHDYARDPGWILTYDAGQHMVAVMDESFFTSIFSQLYVFKKPDPKTFSLIAERYPYYQIWKVLSPDKKETN